MGRAYTILKYIAIFIVFDRFIWPPVIRFVGRTFFSEPGLPLNCKGYDCANGRPGDKAFDDVAAAGETNNWDPLGERPSSREPGTFVPRVGAYVGERGDDMTGKGICHSPPSSPMTPEQLRCVYPIDVEALQTDAVKRMQADEKLLNRHAKLDDKQLRRNNAFLKRRVARLERALKEILDRQTY